MYQQDNGAQRVCIGPISAVLTEGGAGRTVASWRCAFLER